MWKKYRRGGVLEARPAIPGEDLVGITISVMDVGKPGMVARSLLNPQDQWFIPQDEFDRNYYEHEEGCSQ